MSSNAQADPYRKLKVVVTIVAVGAVAIRLGRKVLARREFLYPGVYVEEIPAGSRPIEGVGTSTAGFVGSKVRRSRRS